MTNTGSCYMTGVGPTVLPLQFSRRASARGPRRHAPCWSPVVTGPAVCRQRPSSQYVFISVAHTHESRKRLVTAATYDTRERERERKRGTIDTARRSLRDRPAATDRPAASGRSRRLFTSCARQTSMNGLLAALRRRSPERLLVSEAGRQQSV
jgi:hypothetical protein